MSCWYIIKKTSPRNTNEAGALLCFQQSSKGRKSRVPGYPGDTVRSQLKKQIQTKSALSKAKGEESALNLLQKYGGSQSSSAKGDSGRAAIVTH